MRITHIDQFISEVEVLFDQIAGPWGSILFKEKYRRSIGRAWSAVKRTVVSIRNCLNNLVVNAVSELEAAGLAGAQLHLKLECLDDTWERFVVNGTIFYLRDLLDWIATILSSLARTIPQVEAWKELTVQILKLLDHS